MHCLSMTSRVTCPEASGASWHQAPRPIFRSRVAAGGGGGGAAGAQVVKPTFGTAAPGGLLAGTSQKQLSHNQNLGG